uniref:Putative ixodes 10 kDa peptide protein n=1 Tax=Ixodes ricinus TaxID=34613 RepID=A0A0K8RDJ9_IXORI
MQLVVFAVVMILPSFLSGEFSATIYKVSNECEGSIVDGGILACEKKVTHYSGYDPKACTVRCTDETEVKLPEGVCLNNQVKVCNSDEVKQKLKYWAYNM